MSLLIQNTSKGSSRRARAEASVWMVRLHGTERNPELEGGFQTWLTADPENARQFEHINEVWELGGQITADGIGRMRAGAHTPLRAIWLPAAVTAILLLSVLAAANWAWTRALYVTDHGEQRLVRLEDGSAVYLNSDTRLRVRFDRHVRGVSLEGGEALFEVAKDAARPFIVEAGKERVTALGTTFVVRYERAQTAVTLVEGKVTVAAGDVSPGPVLAPVPGTVRRPLADVVTLTPGEQLVLARNAPPRLDTPSMNAVTAWRRGQVLLDATSLPAAVAEMNRYDRRHLVIDDPKLDALRVSGIYRAGDSLGFAQSVAELEHLGLSQDGNEIHLRVLPPRKDQP